MMKLLADVYDNEGQKVAIAKCAVLTSVAFVAMNREIQNIVIQGAHQAKSQLTKSFHFVLACVRRNKKGVSFMRSGHFQQARVTVSVPSCVGMIDCNANPTQHIILSTPLALDYAGCSG